MDRATNSTQQGWTRWPSNGDWVQYKASSPRFRQNGPPNIRTARGFSRLQRVPEARVGYPFPYPLACLGIFLASNSRAWKPPWARYVCLRFAAMLAETATRPQSPRFTRRPERRAREDGARISLYPGRVRYSRSHGRGVVEKCQGHKIAASSSSRHGLVVAPWQACNCRLLFVH